jgi:translation initiation factor IF-3
MVRVIDDEGKMVGVFQVPDAVKMAYEKSLDLIEISPDANPPTCKMMDFGKYKYQMKKKAAESRKKQVIITVKEVQFRPNTDQHDIDFKVRHIQEFLKQGDKCRIIVTFRGREVTHSELGRALLHKIIATLGDSCVIEQNPLIEGKKMSMLVAPAGTAKPANKPAKAPAGPQQGQTGVKPGTAPAQTQQVAQTTAAAAGDVKK